MNIYNLKHLQIDYDRYITHSNNQQTLECSHIFYQLVKIMQTNLRCQIESHQEDHLLAKHSVPDKQNVFSEHFVFYIFLCIPMSLKEYLTQSSLLSCVKKVLRIRTTLLVHFD